MMITIDTETLGNTIEIRNLRFVSWHWPTDNWHRRWPWYFTPIYARVTLGSKFGLCSTLLQIIRTQWITVPMHWNPKWTVVSMYWYSRAITQSLRRRIMTIMASRITGQSSVSTVCSDWQQRNIKGPRYCASVRGIHRWPVDSPHKGTVTRKMIRLMTPYWTLNRVMRKWENCRNTPNIKSVFCKQRVLMHGHQGWNVRHGLCHIYMRYVYIYMSFL